MTSYNYSRENLYTKTEGSKTLTTSLKKLKQYTKTSPDLKKEPNSSKASTKKAEISKKRLGHLLRSMDLEEAEPEDNLSKHFVVVNNYQ